MPYGGQDTAITDEWEPGAEGGLRSQRLSVTAIRRRRLGAASPSQRRLADRVFLGAAVVTALITVVWLFFVARGRDGGPGSGATGSTARPSCGWRLLLRKVAGLTRGEADASFRSRMGTPFDLRGGPRSEAGLPGRRHDGQLLRLAGPQLGDARDLLRQRLHGAAERAVLPALPPRTYGALFGRQKLRVWGMGELGLPGVALAARLFTRPPARGPRGRPSGARRRPRAGSARPRVPPAR